MIKIIDKSKEGVYSSNMELVDNFVDYSSNNLDFDKPVDVELVDDEQNAKNPLGATAYYSPDEMKIVVYVTGRHLKDILRSISHELIHHVQNCRGDLDPEIKHTDGYAQKDDHLRNMEHEAYTKGNIMNFRDFEDTYKKGKKNMKLTLEELKKIVNEEVSDTLNEEVVEISLKRAGKENHQKEADKKCRERGFDGGKMTRAFRAPSPEGSGAYKCMRCPEGSAPGKANANKLNPMGCGFADGTEPSEEELTRGIRFALGLTGLAGDKATATGKGPGNRRIKYRTCRKLPLRLGCKGDMVMALQSLLHNALKLKISKKKFIDSQYGPATKKAVEAFQRKAKIGVDGVAGKNTFAALRKTQPKKAVAALDKRIDEPTASAAGPTGGDTLEREKLGMEIAGIVRGLMTDFPALIPQNRTDPEYRRIYRTVMRAMAPELKNNRSKYLNDKGEFSRTRVADKVKEFISQNTRG